MLPDENRPTSGPDFADPEAPASNPDASSPGPVFAEPARRTSRTPVTRGPQFADPEPEPAPVPLLPTPAPAEATARRPSAAAKVMGWVVLLAVLGILAGIYLPKEIPTFARKQPLETPAAPPVAQPAVPSNRVAVSSSATVSAAQPSPPPQPAPAVTTSPNALMSAEQVGRTLRDAGDTERAGRDQALGLMIAFLRQPQFQNAEDFAVLKAHLGSVGLSLIPGGATAGHQEIFAAINRGATGAQAAREVEAIGHQPALPAPVEQGLLAVLASATTLPEIMNGVDKVQGDTGMQLSPETIEVIRRHAQEAADSRGAATQRR